MLWRTGRQVAKTVADSAFARVYLANGRPVLGRQLEIGDAVLAVDAQLRTVPGLVTDKFHNPGKQTFRVTTQCGSVLDLAETHPLLTRDGWCPAGQLRVGCRVAVARTGGLFGDTAVADARLALTAYALGAGRRTATGVTVSGLADTERSECLRYARSAGGLSKLTDRVTLSRLPGSELADWLIEDGTADGDLSAGLPTWVFQLSEADTAGFLRRLWRAAGVVRPTPGELPDISCVVKSRNMAFDLKALLTKFGIPTAVRPCRHNLRATAAAHFRLIVSTADGCRQFLTRFEPAMLDRCRLTPEETPDDVVWTRVLSVTPLGVQSCWDIEVATHHTYVLDGVVSHNSTNSAARGIAMSAVTPHFSTLYITPLFEQIRRFSTQYVRPFIDQSPVRALLSNTSTENSVLQKSFINNAKMFFSFAYLSADRIRGLSIDLLSVDESVRIGTLVSTPAGPRPVEQFKPGDPIYSFDEAGRVHTDHVVHCSDHGTRDCYRFEFSDGSAVELTSDSWLATTEGWKRAETVITDLGSNADAVGDDAGRRVNVDALSESDLCQSPRLEPTRVQLSKVPGVVRVRKHSTQEEEERRLRRILQFLDDHNPTRALGYCFYVSPERQEACDERVAGSTDLGGGGLVVHGRRHAAGRVGVQPARGDLYARFLRPRSAADGRLVQDTWTDTTSQTAEVATGSRQDVPRAEVHCRRHTKVCRICSPVPLRGDGVQDRAYGSARVGGLSLVRPYVHAHPEELCRVPYARNTAVLFGGRVPESTQDGNPRQVRVTARKTGADSSAGARVLPVATGSKPRRDPSKTAAIGSQVPGDARRTGASEEETGYEKAARAATGPAVDVPTLPADGAARRQGLPTTLLPGVSADSFDGNQTGVGPEKGLGPVATLTPTTLVSVTWVGRHRVFDLEVEKHNTFFAGGVAVHNCQDIDSTLLPVIAETLSASKYRFQLFTGTPKTLDNTVEGLWGSSSRAEWCINCPSCKKLNVPRMGYDLEKMIGPSHPGIGPLTPPKPAKGLKPRPAGVPGIVCAKCGHWLDPRRGRWIHERPNLRWTFPGYHVPQCIMPMHCEDKERWAELVAKMHGAGNVTTAQFYNEVLGEGYDLGARLVTQTDLQQAALLPWPNEISQAAARIHDYDMRVLGIDWGGGGEGMVSFTTAAVLGWKADGTVDVIYGERLLTPHDHAGEAGRLIQIANQFGCSLVAHDYNGAGNTRETIMAQAGMPVDRFVPFVYNRSASIGIVTHRPATAYHPRQYWQLDKARALTLVCQAIKLKKIRFFQYDYVNKGARGLMHDFLALVEHKVATTRGPEIYAIHRNPSMPDDFAHSVCFGACLLWHVKGQWPNLAGVANMQLSKTQEYSLYGDDGYGS